MAADGGFSLTLTTLNFDPSVSWAIYVRQVRKALERWLTLAREGAFETIHAERESLIDTLVEAAHMPSVQALAFELGLAVDATMQWQGHWDDWHPALLNVLLAAQTAGDRAIQAWLWGRLGALYTLRADYTRATAAYRTTLSIARQLGLRGEVAAAWGLLGLAELARRQDRFSEAQGYVAEALGHARCAGDPTTLGRVYLVGSNAYGAASEWGGAFEYAQMALVYAARTNNAPEQAKALHALGIIYSTGFHRPAQAMVLVRRAAAIYETIGGSHLLGLLDVLLGNLYERLADWPNAESCYRRAMARFERLGTTHDLAMARQNFGMALIERGAWQEAERFLLAALEDWHRLDAPIGRVSALSALGDLYARQGLRGDAVRLWEAALALAQALPPSATLAEITAYIGEQRRGLAMDQPPGGQG